jgi:hypothetical protein
MSKKASGGRKKPDGPSRLLGSNADIESGLAKMTGETDRAETAHHPGCTRQAANDRRRIEVAMRDLVARRGCTKSC